MKVNWFLKWSLCFVIYCEFTKPINAQCLLVEIPLKQQIENASLVVEGKVVEKKSFKNNNDGLIYTVNTVEVYKVFKGIPLSTIDVVTLGGSVGLKALVVYPNLVLQKGDIGIFTLTETNTLSANNKLSKTKQYKPYASVQGFYKYNLHDDLAVNPFNKKQGIKSNFYKDIEKHTNKAFLKTTNFDTEAFQFNNRQNRAKGLNTPSNITLDKSVVSAGTKDVLTITGSGFGATKGSVFFRNSDDGGATFISALDTQVLTWNDIEITVEVPSRAGTGSIFIEDSNNVQSPLSAVLTVVYAEINITFDLNTGFHDVQVQHIGLDSNGGYIFVMQTDFFNDTEHPGARADFENALNDWVCQTGINWSISSTPLASESDGTSDVNQIRFDNGSELDVGILGVQVSWYDGCLEQDSLKAYVIETDIIFDDQTNWHFGDGLPSSNQVDFQSVAIHELGHAHQLAHVIDTVFNGNNLDDVMNYAISNGVQQRVLNNNNITAANNVQNRSINNMACLEPVMTNASCPLGVDDIEFKDAITLYPNPAKNQVFVKNESSTNLKKVVVYDLTGRLVFENTISTNIKTVPINLIGVSSGVYLIEIHSDGPKITKKLIVE